MENRMNVFSRVKEFINQFFSSFFNNVKDNEHHYQNKAVPTRPMPVSVNEKSAVEVIQNKQSVIETNLPKETKQNVSTQTNQLNSDFVNKINTSVVNQNKFPNFTKEEIQADQLKNAKYKETITFYPKLINKTRTTIQKNKSIAVNAHKNVDNSARPISFKDQVLTYINQNFSNKVFNVNEIINNFSDNHSNKSVSATISKLNKAGKITRVQRGIYKLINSHSQEELELIKNKSLIGLQTQVLNYLNENYAGKTFKTKDICITFSDKGHSYGSISGTITKLKNNKKINQIERGVYELTK